MRLSAEEDQAAIGRLFSAGDVVHLDVLALQLGCKRLVGVDRCVEGRELLRRGFVDPQARLARFLERVDVNDGEVVALEVANRVVDLGRPVHRGACRVGNAAEGQGGEGSDDGKLGYAVHGHAPLFACDIATAGLLPERGTLMGLGDRSPSRAAAASKRRLRVASPALRRAGRFRLIGAAFPRLGAGARRANA